MKRFCRSLFEKTALWLVLFLPVISLPAWGQDARPYITKATFYLAFDGWADIWVNGIPVIENQRTTTDDKTYQVTTDIPEHLCYFREENVLAIENANAYNSKPPLNRQIGIAYILKLKLSDGTEESMSSNDLTAQKAFYHPDKELGEPRDWQEPSFNDQSWNAPYAIGEVIPGVVSLSDPEMQQEVQFISAMGPSYQSRLPGEKHLYRRHFHLDIRPNPRCSGQELRASEPSPRILRSVTRPSLVPARPKVSGAPLVDRPTPLTGPMGKDRNPGIPVHRIFPQSVTAVPLTPTATVVPTTGKTEVFPPSLPPSFTPSPTAIPRQVPAWTAPPTAIPAVSWITPTWTPLALPSAIPTIVPTPIFRPVPTLNGFLAPAVVYPKRPRLKRPTPTAIPDFGGSNRAEPFEAKAPSAPPRVPTPVSVQAEETPSTSYGAQTIVFESQPANIYISYADGPGVYRLEVVDASLRPIRTLSEKRVVAQQDDWVEWDGKDDGGQEMPPGQYTVLYTKDGRELKKLVLVKTAYR